MVGNAPHWWACVAPPNPPSVDKMAMGGVRLVGNAFLWEYPNVTVATRVAEDVERLRAASERARRNVDTRYEPSLVEMVVVSVL